VLQTVPAAVPGIVFLSGGQSDVVATEHLNALNQLGKAKAPWQLSFSFGRALQAPALAVWKGQPQNLMAGQQALRLRARCNGAARSGNYSKAMERV
jgi:fructose-bisphosphate aldolase class I